jgi:hypothetical protein
MRGRLAFALAAAATGWCLLLVVGAFVFPAYSGSECRTAPGGALECVSRTATDFEMNGWRVVAMFAAVALVSLLVLFALHWVCTTGSRVAATGAWVGIVALFGFSYLTGLSIGPTIVPVVLLLAASAVLTPKPTALNG